MAGHCCDAAQAQAMVAAEQYGQMPCLQLGKNGAKYLLVPGNDFGQMAVSPAGRLPGICRPEEVAAVDHVQPMALQCCL